MVLQFILKFQNIVDQRTQRNRICKQHSEHSEHMEKAERAVININLFDLKKT